MSKGGIILSHDYAERAGVYKAFNEFFRDKKEGIIEVTGSQCMVIKI
jgi:hypothetical protein